MLIERCADAMARRNIVYIAALPPAGELRTAWALTVPFPVQLGEIVRTADRDARRFEPVLGECALELLDDRTFHATSVSRQWPCIRPVAAPLPHCAGSAGHSNTPVDNQDAAMVAIVRAGPC
jgi:hypothetical protein